MRILGLLDDVAGLSVADVQGRLAGSGHQVAYTTVMTVLGRMHDKGLVRRQRDGKRFLYHSAKRAARAKVRMLSRVQRALFDSQRLKPIAALVDGELSRAELVELRELIDQKLGRG